MRGSYRDAEARRQARELWARDNVPSYAVGEIYPIRPLLSRWDGLVALDVGANKGFWTKALLRTFGEGVRHVYMLDPSPENFRELTERDDNLIFAPADFARVSAFQLAAGAEPGTATLYTNEDGSPLASLYPHASRSLAALESRIEAEVVRLDDFLREQGIERVDVLKIDVEGHEYAVLEGLRGALAAGKVDVILWEFGRHQLESGRRLRDYWELLTPLGYDLYRIDNVAAKRVAEYDPALEDFTTDLMYAARRRAAGPPPLPAGFEEERYLRLNPDVRAAIGRGQFESAAQHWLSFGHQEHRPL